MIFKIKNKEIFRLWQLNVVGSDHPIMTQLTLIGILGFHLRIHRFYSGDRDGFHDHPRHFISLCISGEYVERLIHDQERLVKPGVLTFRRATTAHNVTPVKFPCVTLALTSPVVRQWKRFES